MNNIMSSKPTTTFCTASRSRTEEATTLSEMIPARREKTAWARWGSRRCNLVMMMVVMMVMMMMLQIVNGVRALQIW